MKSRDKHMMSYRVMAVSLYMAGNSSQLTEDDSAQLPSHFQGPEKDLQCGVGAGSGLTTHV